MKRKFLAALVGILCCMSVFSVFACSKSVSKITDMKRFSDMQKTADRIDVEFDNHSGRAYEFSIENAKDIAEIMEILFSESLVNLKGSYPPGNNTYITVIQGENEYTLSVRINKENKNYYSFASNALETKINDIARANGAFDGVE